MVKMKIRSQSGSTLICNLRRKVKIHGVLLPLTWTVGSRKIEETESGGSYELIIWENFWQDRFGLIAI